MPDFAWIKFFIFTQKVIDFCFLLFIYLFIFVGLFSFFFLNLEFLV